MPPQSTSSEPTDLGFRPVDWLYCTSCAALRPGSEFDRRRTKLADGTWGPWRPHTQCRSCRRKKQAAWARAKYTPEVRRRSNLRAFYGISPEDVAALHERQNGRCAICGRVPNGTDQRTYSLHVDHDHVSGRVRGLLCNHCNLALGHFGESTKRLERALAYLRGDLLPLADTKINSD